MDKKEQKELKRRTEEWLNERWRIAIREDSRPQEMSYYNGAIKCCEFLGYEWKRYDDGEHKLF